LNQVSFMVLFFVKTMFIPKSPISILLEILIMGKRIEKLEVSSKNFQGKINVFFQIKCLILMLNDQIFRKQLKKKLLKPSMCKISQTLGRICLSFPFWHSNYCKIYRNCQYLNHAQQIGLSVCKQSFLLKEI